MTAPKPYAQKPQGHVGVCPKIYCVFLPINVDPNGKQPDDYLLAMKLTSAAAERVKAQYPGAYIVRGFATKI